MSRVFTTRDFYGGMNNVSSPHALPQGQAEEIRNLFLAQDGAWHDIGIPTVLLDLSATFFNGATKVYQWFPSILPLDCVDDFVYIVFYDDGDVNMVYRGAEGSTVMVIAVKARTVGGTYLAVTISAITPDIDNAETTDNTSTNAFATFERRYYEGTAVSMTAPTTAGAGTAFFRWVDGDGNIIGYDRQFLINIANTMLLIAEFSAVPYIRIEDGNGLPVSLNEFYAEMGGYSTAQSFYVGGLLLENNLLIYPPENYQVSLNGVTWVSYGSNITIPTATANAGMSIVYVRYAPTE